MRPIVVWPLGKLYRGFDLSGRRFDLYSRAAKYVEGPDGLPYSAHEVKTETRYSYLEFRPKFNTLLGIFETIQYSYTVLMYFLYDALLTDIIFLVDFRCPNSASQNRFDAGLSDRTHSCIQNGKVLRLHVSVHCKTRGFWRNLQPGNWYFISFAYNGKKGLLRTSVNGAFKEYTNPRCVNEVGRMTNCLYLGNNPYRYKFNSVNSEATHRFACFEIHDGFLTAGELLQRQEFCIGRGR
jgi:hypothetical protein